MIIIGSASGVESNNGAVSMCPCNVVTVIDVDSIGLGPICDHNALERVVLQIKVIHIHVSKELFL